MICSTQIEITSSDKVLLNSQTLQGKMKGCFLSAGDQQICPQATNMAD